MSRRRNRDPEAARRRFAGLVGACLLVVAPGVAEGAAAEEDETTGPIPLRIVAPLHVLSYQITPQSAEPLAPGRRVMRLELSESNVLERRSDGDFVFETDLDFELTRLQLAYRRGLRGGWEAGFEVPVLYYHSGFLDTTIFNVEELFGKLKPQRETEVPGSFAYTVSRGDETLFRGSEDQAGLGDVALILSRSLGRGSGWRPSVALRGALALPTGDRDRAFGNGIPELALGLSADWQRGRWSLRSGSAVTLPLDQVDDTSALTSVPVLAGYAELAFHRRPGLGLHLQGAAQSAPFRLHGRLEPASLPAGNDRTLTHHVVQVSPALSWRLAAGRTLYLGVVEDMLNSEDSASDATAFAVLTVSF